MKHSIKTILVFTALLSPALLPAAEPPGKSVRVSFAELDLRKEAGVRELYSRLQRASRTVCDFNNPEIFHRNRQRENCFEETLDSAVSMIENPILEQIHARS